MDGELTDLERNAPALEPAGLVVAQQRVVASVGATYAELVDAVELGVASQLRMPGLDMRPLADGNDALDRLRAGALTSPVQRA